MITTHTAVFDTVPVLLDVLPECITRQQIAALGAELVRLEAGTGIVDLSTKHHHADGIYGRSIVLRAGTLLVGMPHRHSGLAVSAGDITIWTEDGGRQRLIGLHMLASAPGLMRLGFAHRDTTFVTYHANRTGSTDPEVIEDALVEHADMLMTRRTSP